MLGPGWITRVPDLFAILFVAFLYSKVALLHACFRRVFAFFTFAMLLMCNLKNKFDIISLTMLQKYAAAIDRAYRYASKVPGFEISSSDPADQETDVAVDKTITITFSMPMYPASINNSNITINPSVERTTSLDGY